MVEVTIVANEAKFEEGEETRLQWLADKWIMEDKCSIREVMHRFGMKENLSVSIYGDSDQGIVLKCHKASTAAKVATA